MEKLENVFVSESAFNDSEAYKIIGSNISIINLVLEEGGNYGQIAEEALQSYFVDYYADQVNNGNFSQYVYNSRWNASLNNMVKEGLKNMGAKQQLQFFEGQEQFVDSMDRDELTIYFESQYFGENATRDNLNNDTYYKIYQEENIVELNSKWLRQLPNLKVLPFEEIFVMVENLLGKRINRD